eukprot:CAMPEP_0202911266 /NCGR_PEP_ID=MMETSP1392-20130828/54474_1 /ASSEMBLY_ACC=CAM_ASM_000868 /TAXON_ID=225041 /ORGANISM="Chlamydomonas chlamydogama, Strain SAG 11-48b" /LENGTH=70 /DNA_ID=CAMNT_0049601701 /DNA_START=14 /DNA_END=226 /DNA_ORIENTATION=-
MVLVKGVLADYNDNRVADPLQPGGSFSSHSAVKLYEKWPRHRLYESVQPPHLDPIPNTFLEEQVCELRQQ